MQDRTRRLSIALAMALGLQAAAHARPPAPPASAPRIADAMLSALVEANGVPGMGAAVVRDGELLWAGSAGLRDVEAGLPVERDTVFRLASVSKLLTATAAAKLREEGRLDVDAPVQSLLPWLQAPWPALTSRQLAAHVSGMPHYQAVDAGRGGVAYTAVRDAVGIFKDRPLLSAPGTAYAYSSWGYTLLSAVVEQRAGMPFLHYVAREVTPGLAIAADRPATPGGLVSRVYGFSGGRVVPIPAHDFSYTWGGGGMAATPEAIARFGSRMMAGEVVSPATFEWMLQPTPLADGRVAAERDAEVGFGWRTSRDADGERMAHHAGVTEGARSALVLWPRQRLSASVLSNTLWVASIEQTAAMLAAPFGARLPTAPARPCPRNAVGYEGRYAGTPIAGRAHFAVEDGICRGRLELGAGPLRDWLDGFPQRDITSMEVIGLKSAALDRAALVTPIGLHDLRPIGATDTYRVVFGADRVLEVRLSRSR